MELEEKLEIIGLTSKEAAGVEALDFLCYKEELSPRYLGADLINLERLIETYRSNECSSSTTWISYFEQARKGLFLILIRIIRAILQDSFQTQPRMRQISTACQK